MHMEINEFIGNLKEQFEDLDTSGFTADTKFKLNDEYSSLTGMSIIAMVDEKYHITLTGNDLKGAGTIKELFNLVKSKRAI